MNRFSIGLIAVLSITVVILLNILSNKNSKIADQHSIISEQQSELKTWKDKEGRARAEKQAVISSIETLKLHNEEQLKEIERLFDIRIKNMQSLLQASIKYASREKVVLKDSIITLNDTIKYYAKNFHLKDSIWADIRGTVIEDSVDINYKFYDSLTFITNYEKNGLFKPKTLKISAISHNPHAEYSGLKSITIKDVKQKRFSIGPHVGIDITGKPTFGISLQYSLIKL